LLVNFRTKNTVVYNWVMKKTAQQIQDEIFRKMSANRKVKLGSDMWRLAKALNGEKIDFRVNGSTTSAGKNS